MTFCHCCDEDPITTLIYDYKVITGNLPAGITSMLCGEEHGEVDEF